MRYITLACVLFITIFVSAQVQNYTFSASTGTYTPITGGTVLQSGTFDAFNSTAINLSFRYNCIQVSSLKVNADGHIGLGNYISTANYTPLSGTINASIGILSAVGRDLASSDVGSPEIRYEVIGDEFIAQWTDVRRSGTFGERINFQIRINTVTNVINYVYGPYISGVANTNYPEIGLKGTNNIFPTNVKNIKLACGETGWLGVTPGTANNSKVCLSNATFPASGTTFTWSPPSPATPDAIVGSAAQCPGATAQTYSITAVPNATTYTWTVPTGWTITAGAGTNSISVTAGTTGQNGDISVSATDLCGTSSASTLAVSVGDAAPSAPGTITGSTTLCVGSTSQSYSVSAVTNATTYSWTVPTGWTITSGAGTNSIVVTPGTAGQNGLISVTAGNACGTSQGSTLQVSVNPLPSVNAGSDTTVCANDFPISLTATGNATSYSWNTGANTATTTITTAGTYTVTGTLNGCSSSDNVVVISDPCAGIEENHELTFQLYPNPSNAMIHITSNSEEQFDYSIYSMDGKLMLVGVMNNGTTSINVDHFAPGKYFTKIGAKVIAFEVIP